MVTGNLKRKSLLFLIVAFSFCLIASLFTASFVAKADTLTADDFFMVDGAQVRVTFEDDAYQNAIRFTTKIEKSKLPVEGQD